LLPGNIKGEEKMVLETIWFLLWGLLWAVFFMTDGFDFGVGILLPFMGKNQQERRTMINAVGPLWDGNEVWLLTAGGVTFAAFPMVYAVMFSSLYSALMMILFALILRGVSLEFRSHVENPHWRTIWDSCFFIGSFLPALLFGVAFANIFKGLPIDHQGMYQGNLFTLLNPYGLLGGAFFLSLFIMHGMLWLGIRTEGQLQSRAVQAASKFWPILTVLVIVFLAATKFATPLFDNYLEYPLLFIIVLLAVFGLAGIRFFLSQSTYYKAWLSSALLIVGVTFFGIAGLYPNMFPSSIDPGFSLTAHNAASSALTLKIMLTVVVVFVPVVIAYQVWAYHLFKDKVVTDEFAESEGY